MSSSCVPCSTTLAPFPSVFSKMQILSAFRIVDKRCAMTMVVRFELLTKESRASCTRRSFSVSSALVASSKIRIGGFRSAARAIATRCF
mmetsp:Transcript_7479/g.28111  ORF Transcript_7479/g.28111 Transcript_7479/m.28111 type:complete len:89 (+) Transcript_7479:146-412(+)